MIAACMHDVQPYMYGAEPLFHFIAPGLGPSSGAVTSTNVPSITLATATTHVPRRGGSRDAYAAVTPLSWLMAARNSPTWTAPPTSGSQNAGRRRTRRITATTRATTNTTTPPMSFST